MSHEQWPDEVQEVIKRALIRAGVEQGLWSQVASALSRIPGLLKFSDEQIAYMARRQVRWIVAAENRVAARRERILNRHAHEMGSLIAESPLDAMAEDDLKQRLREFLASLSQEEWSVLRMRVLQDCTYEQIAHGTSLSTARVRRVYLRILEQLRDTMKDSSLH